MTLVVFTFFLCGRCNDRLVKQKKIDRFPLAFSKVAPLIGKNAHLTTSAANEMTDDD